MAGANILAFRRYPISAESILALADGSALTLARMVDQPTPGEFDQAEALMKEHAIES